MIETSKSRKLQQLLELEFADLYCCVKTVNLFFGSKNETTNVETSNIVTSKYRNVETSIVDCSGSFPFCCVLYEVSQ